MDTLLHAKWAQLNVNVVYYFHCTAMGIESELGEGVEEQVKSLKKQKKLNPELNSKRKVERVFVYPPEKNRERDTKKW